MEWDDQPCELVYFRKEIDCILAIDENGTSNMLESNMYNAGNRYFTLTGISINLEKYNSIRDNMMEIKYNYWKLGLFNKKRIVLHSKDIRKKQGPFNPKLIDNQSFLKDMLEFFSLLPIKIYSVTIDKKQHAEKYITPYDPYEIGLEFIIERFCFELRRQNLNGVIMLESRGKREDKDVLKRVTRLLEQGNMFQHNSTFSCIKGVYFNPKRTEDGSQSYWPLEICDIVTYSIHYYIKNNKHDWLFQNIESKIYGYPNYWGRGIKKFP